MNRFVLIAVCSLATGCGSHKTSAAEDNNARVLDRCDGVAGLAAEIANDWLPHGHDDDACPPGAAEAGKPGCNLPYQAPTFSFNERAWFARLVTICREASAPVPKRDEIDETMARVAQHANPAKVYALGVCLLMRQPTPTEDPIEKTCRALRLAIAEQLGHDATQSGCWSEVDCLLFDDPPTCCGKFTVTYKDLGLRSIGARAPWPPSSKSAP